MAVTLTADVQRMIEVGQADVFMRNFEAFPVEYTGFSQQVPSMKKTETYDSVGNLKPASEKTEQGSITYGKIEQAYQTSITNKVITNGFSYGMEAAMYDLYNVIDNANVKELVRTMREYEEDRVIYWYDNAFTVNLADGVPMCSNSKPLLNNPGEFNDSLAAAASIGVPDNHQAMMNLFPLFKNHQGGPMRTYPTDGMTHRVNMFTVEEIYRSVRKASEMSNTANVLPDITWHYSTYLTSQTAYFMFDKSYQHVLFQRHVNGGTQFNSDVDVIHTLNIFNNAVAVYNTGALPNIGMVGSQGA